MLADTSTMRVAWLTHAAGLNGGNSNGSATLAGPFARAVARRRVG